MKVYTVSKGERCEGGDVEGVFTSLRKAFDLVGHIQSQNSWVTWKETDKYTWEGGSLYIVVIAFDTDTGLEIPWD